MNEFIEKLKDALCSTDIPFLEEHKHDYSIDYRFSDEDNDTLLLYALSDPDSNIYSYILENEADISLQNDEKENIIHSVVYSGKPERLTGLANRENINHQSSDGTTPLLLAIGLKDRDMFLQLIRLGADINITDNEMNSPIHVACFTGDKNIVQELVECGAKLSLKTEKGNLPFALAVNEEHHEVVKYLYRILYP